MNARALGAHRCLVDMTVMKTRMRVHSCRACERIVMHCDPRWPSEAYAPWGEVLARVTVGRWTRTMGQAPPLPRPS